MGTETDIFSRPVSRRTLLRATGASAAAIALWPSLAHAQVLIVPSVINPYSGSIPLVFPLKRNTYGKRCH